jgi:hypothetical protein
VLLRLALVRLAALLGAPEKVLVTDFCNRPTTREPADRSTPELAARAAKTAFRAFHWSRSPNEEFGKRRRTTFR